MLVQHSYTDKRGKDIHGSSRRCSRGRWKIYDMYACKSAVWSRPALRRCKFRLDHFLEIVEFNSNSEDPGLYVERFKNRGLMIIALYVDELWLARNSVENVKWINLKFANIFEYAFSVRVKCGNESCHLVSTTRKHCRMPDSKYCTSIILSTSRTGYCFHHRGAIWSLMYLLIAIRPDIAFDVPKKSQFCGRPAWSHWSAINHIFRP